MTDLQVIRDALAAATPGPWRRGDTVPGAVFSTVGGRRRHIVAAGPSSIGTIEDVVLIANAPAWLAELVDEVERLRAEVCRLRGAQ